MNDSKKQHRDMIIVIMLLLVLAGSMMYSKSRNAKKPAIPPAPGASEINAAKASERLNISLTKNANLPAEKTALRDPFEIPDSVIAEIRSAQKIDKGASVVGTKKTDALVLEGVIWGGEKNLAIISGEVVSEGEMIKDARVLAIGENGVVLSKDGREIKLTR